MPDNGCLLAPHSDAVDGDGEMPLAHGTPSPPLPPTPLSESRLAVVESSEARLLETGSHQGDGRSQPDRMRCTARHEASRLDLIKMVPRSETSGRKATGRPDRRTRARKNIFIHRVKRMMWFGKGDGYLIAGSLHSGLNNHQNNHASLPPARLPTARRPLPTTTLIPPSPSQSSIPYSIRILLRSGGR